RGAGYEVAWEALTQGERSVVYDVREFSRFREQFLIDVTQRFYNLVAQKQVLENTKRRFEDAEFQMKRTQALFEVGRQGQIEVLRSKNDMLRVEDDLLDAQQDYDLTIDQFKLFLGLPTSVELTLAEEAPEFIPVDVTLNSAIAAAMANRYDLVNAREQLEDQDRALRIAHNNLLPDLDLTVSGSTSSDTTDKFLDQRYRTRSNSIGLSLEIPLQRTQERNALRSAQIALDRQRRDFEEFRDNIVVEVRETLRDIRRQATSLDIQQQIIEVEERRVRKARIDFAAGDIGNRDVVEAERSLLDARNARINQLVDYEILRIRVERVMGTLHVEPDGTWHALRSPAMASMGADGNMDGGTKR
ncbi:MAG: TolC family protein, partial [Planctomycetota bacterium]